MSEKLWWAIFGLFVLVWVLAVVTESRMLAVIAILIVIALAADTRRRYRGEGEDR